MEPLQGYDILGNILAIGDRDISAGGEDGAIEFEPASESAWLARTMINGNSTVSRDHTNNATVAVITVDSHSRAARDLDELYETQIKDSAAQAGIAPREFYFEDPSDGTKVTDQNAVIMNKPSANRGQTTADITVAIFLPSGNAPGKSPRAPLIT